MISDDLFRKPLMGRSNKVFLHFISFRISYINPFSAKGFPFDEQNRLALDRVKSVSTSLALKGLRGIVF